MLRGGAEAHARALVPPRSSGEPNRANAAWRKGGKEERTAELEEVSDSIEKSVEHFFLRPVRRDCDDDSLGAVLSRRLKAERKTKQN